MRIFISWSGEKSNMLAKALREWLPAVIQAVRPYLSTDDTKDDARWNADVSKELQEAKVGLLCITNENLNAPWIMFEAGALAKSLEVSFVIPILLDIEPSALIGPLAQFQAIRLHQTDMKRLVQTVNKQLGSASLEEKVLSSLFRKRWPDLESRIGAILKTETHKSAPPPRSDRELLEEVLSHVRYMNLRRPAANANFSEFSRLLDISVTDLNFTDQTERCLIEGKIKTLADIIVRSEVDLLKLPKLGRRNLTEIKEILASGNLRLKAEDDVF